MLIASGGLVNTCHFYYEAYNNPAFVAEVFPDSSHYYQFAQSCAYSTSNGNILQQLDQNTQFGFDQSNLVYLGFDSYSQYLNEYKAKNLTNSASIHNYTNYLSNLKSFDANNFQNVDEQDSYTKAFELLNT